MIAKPKRKANITATNTFNLIFEKKIAIWTWNYFWHSVFVTAIA